jgi:prepilin-type N-terminal cleavage/methylation domain-containing protein
LAWRVFLHDGRTPEAYSRAGGQIVLSAGFLQRYEPDDAQLGFIMGHEIAHVLCQHERIRLSAVWKRNAPQQLRALYAMEYLDTEPMVRAQIAAVANAQERTADRIGMELVAAIGADPLDALRLLNKSAVAEGGGMMPDVHDPAIKRKAALLQDLSAPAGLLKIRQSHRLNCAPGVRKQSHTVRKKACNEERARRGPQAPRVYRARQAQRGVGLAEHLAAASDAAAVFTTPRANRRNYVEPRQNAWRPYLCTATIQHGTPGSRRGIVRSAVHFFGRNNLRRQHGFTLIEVALVLVIVGLGLGGVMRGQELISAARVRNVASQVDGVKLAYLGFRDRFRQLPGDLPADIANANIPGNPGGCGPTNRTPAFCGNGRIDPAENLVVWAQLSRANFIYGTYEGTVGPSQAFSVIPATTTNPVNSFGGFLMLVSDSDFGDATTTTPAAIMNVKTGGNVPPWTLAELDRKLDDGFAGTGSYRVAPQWDNVTANCYTGALGSVTLGYAAASDTKTCGAAVLQ